MKSTSTHTPGPWHVGGFVPKSDAQKMAYIGIGDGAQHLARASVTQCVDRIEAEANAKLIAAAPALAEALRSICEQFDVVPTLSDSDLSALACNTAMVTRKDTARIAYKNGPTLYRDNAHALKQAIEQARAALAQIDGGAQ